MSPALRNPVVFAAPDLDSWFVQELSIEESRPEGQQFFAGLSISLHRWGRPDEAVRAAKEALSWAESRAGSDSTAILDLAAA